MNYNFVIFATVFDWYRYMYQDILGQENVQFYGDINELFNPIERALYKVHFSKKINKIMNLPGKEIWFKRALKKIQFQNSNSVCFIWYSHFLTEIKRGMVEAIKKEMPDSKHVYYITDAKHADAEELDWLKQKMDAIGVFDPTIAEAHDIEFWPNVYPSTKEQKYEEEYDLCFIGKDKGRKSKLEEIALLCEEKGLRTAFYLMTPSKERPAQNIHYIDELIPYKKTLEIMLKSKCLLELKMDNLNTCSVRVQEAVIFNKKLLTDNKNVAKMPCCADSQYISYFDTVEEIDWNFVKEPENVDYHYAGEFSAKAFLETIQEKLQ